MEYQEEEYLNLSGLQHFAFCRRQWAMIHIEQQWQENYRTVAGEILHEKAHDETITEHRKNVIRSRGIHIASKTLGLSGACDVVEFREVKDGITLNGYSGQYEVYPIEYKRGEPKETDIDELQLCAEAMCLEEMLVCNISKGYLYYGECKRRYVVELTEELREKVKRYTADMHEYYQRKYTPKVKRTKACNACSLKELCIPQMYKAKSVKEYIKTYYESET